MLSLVDCPYCHIPGGREVSQSPRTVACERCGLYRLVPRMSREEQIACLVQMGTGRDIRRDWGHPADRLHVCRWELTLIGRTFPGLLQGGHILDVGAGSGYFAYALGQIGSKAVGLEPVSEVAEYGRSFGIDLHCGRFEPENLPQEIARQRFDLICLRESLPYFPDTKGAFDLIRRLLTPEGRLYIKSHNAESYSYLVGQDNYALRMGAYGSALPTRWALTYILEQERFGVAYSGYYPFSDPISDLGWPRVGRTLPGRIANKLLQPLLNVLGQNDRIVILAAKA